MAQPTVNEGTPIFGPPPTKAPGVSDLVRQPSFLAAWLVPFTIFIITTGLFEYVYFSVAELCVFWAVFVLLAAIAMMLASAARRYAAIPLVGIATLPALFLGILVGLYLYDTYAIFPKFYSNTRKYTNVVPAQPAGAVADAGKLVFTHESYVDTKQSVGYILESGQKYCAAPVRDGSGIERIEFWAVGIDCCAKTGDFYCDSAGDNSAKAGIVVFDNNGYFEESRLDHYDQARKKAEAEYSLQSVADPVFVRWVEESNLNKLSDHYSSRAIIFYIVFSLVYLVSAAFLASVLAGNTKL